MLKPFCNVCSQPIIDNGFLPLAVPLNGTGAKVHITVTACPEDFHVHQSCVFDSIRAAERRLNERPVEER